MVSAKENVDELINHDVAKSCRQEDVQEQPTERNTKHEREAEWGNYFRVFTYAKKRNFVLMAAAAVASIGAGVVRSPSKE